MEKMTIISPKQERATRRAEIGFAIGICLILFISILAGIK